ncbi:alpha/beta hydrolase [Pontixanthobacter gangjinensis]|uniref:Alpha/beta fold hydrolase n=1 Tax=Pontixanthobacter gangjinensis TaxID=1028742 RepID=A0A6I4SPJ5_9SPHN|nr:alpha/beta hydrolase [Pontixanthobacter gangjinensis]MXO57694.1 alpha/beta fold hydrolase [Pontixanthobacter gangjinensis]
MTKHQNITAAGTHYTREGEGPALVFIHGAGGNAAVWFQQVEAFAPNHTVICIDLPGFGQTPARDGGFDPDRLDEVVLEVMDHAGVEKGTLIGQSLGGWFALRAALAAQERVEHLVLSCSMAGVAHGPAMQAFAAALQNIGPEGLAEMTLSEQFEKASATKSFLFRQITAFNPPPNPAAIGPLFAPSALLPEEQLAKIPFPVLMISGEDDPIWPPGSLAAMADNFPHAQQKVISGTGHSPYFERPKSFNRMLSRFLGDPE